MSKSDNKKRSIERKIYFYKVVCMDGCNEIKMDSIFASYIKYLNNDYSDLEKRGLVVPYFDKYHFLDVEMHDYDKDVFKGRFYSLRSNDFPYLFNISSSISSKVYGGPSFSSSSNLFFNSISIMLPPDNTCHNKSSEHIIQEENT